MTIHQHPGRPPGRRLQGVGLVLVAAALAACNEPTTAVAPPERPSLEAGGLAVASVRTLALLPGATQQYSTAEDANDLGQIVGVSSSALGVVPVVWDAAGAPAELPGLQPGDPAQANAISEDGTTIVGNAWDGAAIVAARWVRTVGDWVPYALPIPSGGFDLCDATETNADGSVIVGYCIVAATSYSAAIVWRSGVPLAVGGGQATGVNESAQVVGESSNDVATRWTLSGGLLNLGTLGGLVSSAKAINEKGEVVGFSYLADGAGSHAFLWTEKKGMVDLGGPGSASEAVDVNDDAQAVGFAIVDVGGGTSLTHPALWAKGKFVDLPLPVGYVLGAAQGITNTGMIVGYVVGTNSFLAAVWQLR